MDSQSTFKCTFKFFGMLRVITGENDKEKRFDTPVTIKEAILELADNYGTKFRNELFEGHELSDEYLVLLNGEKVEEPDGPETKLKNGDEITIIPGFSFAGG